MLVIERSFVILTTSNGHLVGSRSSHLHASGWCASGSRDQTLSIKNKGKEIYGYVTNILKQLRGDNSEYRLNPLNTWLFCDHSTINLVVSRKAEDAMEK